MPELGGGALYDIGCYCINLSRMLFGREPTRVEASLTRDETGTDVLTSGLLAFGEDVAAFACSTRSEPDQRVHIYGTKGRISIGIPFNIPPDRPAEITVTSETLTFPAADMYTIQAERFAGAALDGEPPPIPPEDAIGNLRVMEAVFRAGERA